MATKKFSQMVTKKLNALLATASDEDKKAIEAVLAAREQAPAAPAAPAAPEATAEETPALLSQPQKRRLPLLQVQKQLSSALRKKQRSRQVKRMAGSTRFTMAAR